MQEGELVLTDRLIDLKGDFEAQRQAVLMFPFKPHSRTGPLPLDEEWDEEPGTWDEVTIAYWFGALDDDQLDELQAMDVAKGNRQRGKIPKPRPKIVGVPETHEGVWISHPYGISEVHGDSVADAKSETGGA